MIDDVQPGQDANQGTLDMGTLSVQEAAAHYGVTEKTIRRRIKAGSLRAIKHGIAEGFEWRVYPEGSLDSSKGSQGTHGIEPNQANQGIQAGQESLAVPPVVRTLIDELRQEYRERIVELEEKNERNLAAAAHWQARAQEQERRAMHAEEQVKLLMAPKDEPTPAEPEQSHTPDLPHRSWLRRLLGL